MRGIIGKKIGMTSIFNADGKHVPCTIIEAGPCTVTQVKTQDTDGYNALQLAFGEKKEKHTTQAQQGHFDKSGSTPKKIIKELSDNPEVTVLVSSHDLVHTVEVCTRIVALNKGEVVKDIVTSDETLKELEAFFAV